MNDHQEKELLLDLAKLLKKYGPETFEALGRQLSSPDLLDRLRSLLLAAATAAREARGGDDRPKAATSPADFRLSLVRLQQAEPEKSALLVGLYDKLMARMILPSMRDLREFASRAKIPPLSDRTRPKAVLSLLAGLQGRSLTDLQGLLADVRAVARDDDDRSLEGWTRIILDKDLRSKRAQ